MANSQVESSPLSSDLAAPEGFYTIREIQDLPSDQIRANIFVNVIGLVEDYRPPVQTKGNDEKCTIRIKDYSIQYETRGMEIFIFWPREKMPKISGASDAVLVRRAKVQMYGGNVSILANKASEFHVLPANQIPKTFGTISNILWQSPRGSKKPSLSETAYVVSLNSQKDQMALPSSQEFQEQTTRAMNVKDKFSLLQNVETGKFHNLLGEVISVFDGNSSRLTVYLSDYTAHTNFYNYAWDGKDQSSGSREGDEYGYTKAAKSKAEKAWPGPYGKLTIQLTLWDEHAEFVRENVKAGQWIFLRNVQIKFGNMGGCLEGFLRGDNGKMNVRVMEQSEEPDQNDDQWKEAVRRKLEYQQRFQKQKKEFDEEAAGLGKRKRGEETKKGNGKMRRKEQRAAMQNKVAAQEAKVAEKYDLNVNVRCSHPDISIVPLSTLLRHHTVTLPETDDKVILPFIIGKYRANVRVVGYFPHNIEDFAIGRRVSEYDMLSDYSGGEDTDYEESMKAFKNGKGFPKKNWEWRFALEVQDAEAAGESRGKDKEKKRVLLMVDNHSAQGLLNMDAANLRADPDTLQKLKEKLCILWGDLEEKKSALLKQQSKPTIRSSPEEPASSSPPQRVGDQPALDSDDEDSKPVKRRPLAERDGNNSQSTNGGKRENQQEKGVDPYHPEVKNKAFTCCIKQYGIKVDEEDETKANAGVRKKWERRFGLFGVIIL